MLCSQAIRRKNKVSRPKALALRCGTLHRIAQWKPPNNRYKYCLYAQVMVRALVAPSEDRPRYLVGVKLPRNAIVLELI